MTADDDADREVVRDPQRSRVGRRRAIDSRDLPPPPCPSPKTRGIGPDRVPRSHEGSGCNYFFLAFLAFLALALAFLAFAFFAASSFLIL